MLTIDNFKNLLPWTTKYRLGQKITWSIEDWPQKIDSFPKNKILSSYLSMDNDFSPYNIDFILTAKLYLDLVCLFLTIQKVGFQSKTLTIEDQLCIFSYTHEQT